MSENLEDQNPEMDQVDEQVADQIDVQPEGEESEEATPRVARSASNQPLISEEQAREHAGVSTPVRPVRRAVPRARRMSLSLTRVDAWSVAKRVLAQHRAVRRHDFLDHRGRAVHRADHHHRVAL